MKRLLAAILTVLMLVPALAACAGDGGAADTTAAPAASTTAPTETTADPYALPHIPDTLKREDEEFRFLDYDGSPGNYGVYWATYDVFAEVITGDILNDAVYKRNLYVQERYGVTIAETKVADVDSEIDRMFNAQVDEYDAVIGNLTQMSTMTTKQQLTELSGVPYLDLSRSWWDQNQLRDMSIAGKNYYASGDIMIIDNDATFAIIFNKEMAKDNQLGDLYAMVDEGKWTFEAMETMMKQVVRDLNGDSAMSYKDDVLGMSTGVISTEALFYAAGMSQTRKTAEDLPELQLDIDKLSSFVGKAYQLCVNTEQCLNYNIQVTNYNGDTADAAKDLFAERRALFFGETLQGITRLRSSDVDFGIIPYPKWDEAQEQYLSHEVAVGTAVGIPTTNTDLELAGAVLETLAARGQEILTPAYYDIVLIGRGLRDVESEPMVELILANRVYDLGYLYNWGNFHTSLRTLVQNNQPNVASQAKVIEKMFKMNLKKTVEAITG